MISKNILTTMREQAIRAKFMTYAINNTLTGAIFTLKYVSRRTLVTINVPYDTVRDTKMRIISTNEEKRSTLEYVRNTRKNTRLTITVQRIVLSIVEESKKILRKS